MSSKFSFSRKLWLWSTIGDCTLAIKIACGKLISDLLQIDTCFQVWSLDSGLNIYNANSKLSLKTLKWWPCKVLTLHVKLIEVIIELKTRTCNKTTDIAHSCRAINRLQSCQSWLHSARKAPYSAFQIWAATKYCFNFSKFSIRLFKIRRSFFSLFLNSQFKFAYGWTQWTKCIFFMVYYNLKKITINI